MKGKLIKTRVRGTKNYIYKNLDTVSSIDIFNDTIFINFADGESFINKRCNSELEAQMIFAKLKNYFGVNEELSELLEDSYLTRL